MSVLSKKLGVLDIGSNSVRAIVYADGKIVYRDLITSRLGEGLSSTRRMSAEAIARTVAAISRLGEECRNHGAEEIYPFATEAVRSADNTDEFLSLAENAGYAVEVIDGDEEGELGLLGAIDGGDGGIIDIGGASTEITAAQGGKIIYSHSLSLGAVRLKDMCGEDEVKLREVIAGRLDEYGKIPSDVEYKFIGGTATSLCTAVKGINGYDPRVIDGKFLYAEELDKFLTDARGLTPFERSQKYHITEKRAEIIIGGTFLIKMIYEKFGIKRTEISVNDNMLGYVRKRFLGHGYARE
ncbi:MAG: hypothetical protein J5903_02790 [Clostridia bacterium]|nr:hypothetical protein [Clostridia bacterium]